MGLLALLLTVLAGFLLMHRLQTSSMQSVRLEIDSWKMPLMVLRWSLVAWVALGWQGLVGFLEHAGLIGQSRSGPVLSMRWRVIGWLLLLELVIGQGMVSAFAALIAGAGG